MSSFDRQVVEPEPTPAYWLWIIGAIVAGAALIAQFQVGGITWSWACEDYAEEKAIENVVDGFRPYDSYEFAGIWIIGKCTPTYSNR